MSAGLSVTLAEKLAASSDAMKIWRDRWPRRAGRSPGVQARFQGVFGADACRGQHPRAAERRGRDPESGAMLSDAGTDPEMKASAEEEAQALKQRAPDLEQKIRVLLVPKDEADDLKVILEVRAGVGGDEVALFARELFDMYRNDALVKRWKFEQMDVSETGLGGDSKATAKINGRGVFARLNSNRRAPGAARAGDRGRRPGSYLRGHRGGAAGSGRGRYPDRGQGPAHRRCPRRRSRRPIGEHDRHAVRITHIPTGRCGCRRRTRNPSTRTRPRRSKVLVLPRSYEANSGRRRRPSARRARKSQAGSG